METGITVSTFENNRMVRQTSFVQSASTVELSREKNWCGLEILARPGSAYPDVGLVLFYQTNHG